VHRGFHVYPNTFCRLDGLMWGALLAVLFRSRDFARQDHVRTAWIVLLVAAMSACATAGRIEWAVYSFTALASVALVYLALTSKQKWFQAILTNRFLMYSGLISYGIYLLEKIPIDGVKSFHLDGHYPAIILLLTSGMTYALATLSWYLLEQPFLRLKRFFERRSALVGEAMLAPAS